MPDKLTTVLKTLSDKKASAIDFFDFRGGMFIHDAMIIASASNPRLLDALSGYVIEALEKDDFEIHHMEGSCDSGWILIDTPDLVIHLFLEETRSYYQLDLLWSDKKAGHHD